jgi:hypothetical protein
MKQIFIAVLKLISVNVFAQSPAGVDKTLTKPATPMTAIEYQFKFLKADSGASIGKKLFVYDSAFFKGRVYANIIPDPSDSGSQVANTAFVKRLLGTIGVNDTTNRWVYAITKNSTADSIIYYRGGVRYAIKDSIGATSFVRDTVGAKAPTLKATVVNAHRVDIEVDSAYMATKRYVDSLVAAGGGGGSNIYNSDGTLTGNRTVSSPAGHSLYLSTEGIGTGRYTEIGVDSAGVQMAHDNSTGQSAAVLIDDTQIQLNYNNTNTVIIKGDHTSFSLPIGISNATPAYTLDVTGDIYASKGVTESVNNDLNIGSDYTATEAGVYHITAADGVGKFILPKPNLKTGKTIKIIYDRDLVPSHIEDFNGDPLKDKNFNTLDSIHTGIYDFVSDGTTWSQVGGADNWLEYTAIVSQSGTSAPTATELINNTGRTFIWTRGSMGEYVVICSASILASGKTSLVIGQTNTGTSNIFITSINRSSAATVGVYTMDAIGVAPVDDVLNETTVTIKIYP